MVGIRWHYSPYTSVGSCLCHLKADDDRVPSLYVAKVYAYVCACRGDGLHIVCQTSANLSIAETLLGAWCYVAEKC